jgi:hypothetical protein
MKIAILRLILALLAAIIISSCNKESMPVKPLARTIKYNLYTEKDFSTDNHNISFSLLIRDGSKILLDSVVATMKVKDVPNLANKLVFEKTILYNNTDLTVGFRYTIEDVGYSWHLDTFKAGETNKVFNFSFQ